MFKYLFLFFLSCTPSSGLIPQAWIAFPLDYAHNASTQDLAGLLGCAIYMCNYTLVVNGKCNASALRAVSANIVSALLVLFSLSANFNIGSALMQCFGITVGSLRLFVIANSHFKNTSHKYLPSNYQSTSLAN